MDPVTPQNSAAKQDQIASGSPWQPAFPHSVGDFQWADSRRAAQMRKSAALVMPPGSTSAPAMVACRGDGDGPVDRLGTHKTIYKYINIDYI